MSEMTGQHISEGPIYFTLCPHAEPSRVQRSCFGKTRHKSDITMSCFQKKNNDKFLQVWVYHSLTNW